MRDASDLRLLTERSGLCLLLVNLAKVVLAGSEGRYLLLTTNRVSQPEQNDFEPWSSYLEVLCVLSGEYLRVDTSLLWNFDSVHPNSPDKLIINYTGSPP